MAFLSVVQLLAGAPLMDANHGDTNGPRGLSDAEAEVAIVGINVAALLEGLDDLDNGFEETIL